jgi:hypothetical protein
MNMWKFFIVCFSTNLNKRNNYIPPGKKNERKKKRPRHMMLEIQVLACDRHKKFTKSKTSNSAKTIHFVKQKSLLEPDTRSLDGFHDTERKHIHEIDEGKLIFGSLRSCSSLPEILSKSYDHYLTVSRKTLSFSQQIGCLVPVVISV